MRTKIYLNLLHHNVFNLIKSSKNVSDIVNKSSVSFFYYYSSSKKEFRGICCSRQNHYMTCKNKHRLVTVLEEISLDLHCHIASMTNPRMSIFSRKVIRTNTESSVEVGLFVTTHSLSFVYSDSKE